MGATTGGVVVENPGGAARSMMVWSIRGYWKTTSSLREGGVSWGTDAIQEPFHWKLYWVTLGTRLVSIIIPWQSTWKPAWRSWRRGASALETSNCPVAPQNSSRRFWRSAGFNPLQARRSESPCWPDPSIVQEIDAVPSCGSKAILARVSARL